MRWATLAVLTVLTSLITLLALGAGTASRAQQPAAAAHPATHGASPPGEARLPRVFLVHSYDPQYLWSQGISQGVQETLRGRAALEVLYLNVKQQQEQESLDQRVANILARIEAEKPQVVIAADDAAQQHLVQPFLKGRASPQVIFCGVNAPPKQYGYPAANVSGVRGRWHFRQSFALLKNIVPTAKRVIFLTDASQSSDYVVADLKADGRQGGRFALSLVAVEQAGSFQQWQSRVRAAQTRADALALGIYHSLRDERSGAPVTPEAVMAWTRGANKLPTIGFSDYAIKHGQLCGVLGSALEQGQLAGAMARQVLEHGVAAGSLAIRSNQTGTVLVNLKTAEQLGVLVPYAIIEAAGVLVR